MSRRFWLLPLLVWAVGCVPELAPETPRDGDASDEQLLCTPGSFSVCICTNGQMGSRRCADGGMNLEACVCPEPDAPEPFCGDGYIAAGEVCDDGDLNDNDGCDRSCQAPTGAEIWTATHSGGPLDDFATDITLDEAGNLYVVGFERREEVARAWVRKYTPAGTPLWTRTAVDGGGGDLEAYGVAAADGQLAVVGRIARGEDETRAFVHMYSYEGARRWEQSLAGPGDGRDGAYAAAFADDQTLIVCGERSTLQGDAQIWISRLEHTGKPRWHEEFGGDGNDRAADCVLDGDAVIVVGTEASFDAPGEPPVYPWLARISLGGASPVTVWTAHVTDSIAVVGDAEASVAVSPRGDIIVAFEGETQIGAHRTWLARLTPGANIVWDKLTGELASERGVGVATAPGGDIVLVSARGVGPGNSDLWIRRFDEDGATLWTTSHDGPAGDRDQGLAVAVDPQGSAYVAGVQTLAEQGLDVLVRKYAP
ncbi:MAG: hypothetical protein KC636_23005 [Myxococcales bacterium]|nr:hypothetical protein [Myxococcales bacterium]